MSNYEQLVKVLRFDFLFTTVFLVWRCMQEAHSAMLPVLVVVMFF